MSEKMIVACPQCRTRFVAPLEKFLPNGRKVRCAKCGHKWFQEVEIDEASQSVAAQPEDTTSAEAPKTSPEERRSPVEAVGAAYDAGHRPARTDPDDAAPAAASTLASQTDAAKADPMPQISRVDPPQRRGGFGRFLFYSLAALLILGAIAYFWREPLAERFPALEPGLTAYGERVDGIVDSVIAPAQALRIENVKYDFEDIEGGRALLLSAEVLNTGDEPAEAPTLVMKVLGPDDAVLHEASLPTEDLSTEIEPSQRAPYFLRVPHPPEQLARVEVDFSATP